MVSCRQKLWVTTTMRFVIKSRRCKISSEACTVQGHGQWWRHLGSRARLGQRDPAWADARLCSLSRTPGSGPSIRYSRERHCASGCQRDRSASWWGWHAQTVVAAKNCSCNRDLCCRLWLGTKQCTTARHAASGISFCHTARFSMRRTTGWRRLTSYFGSML